MSPLTLHTNPLQTLRCPVDNANPNIDIYPNPANNILRISTNNDDIVEQIIIYDVTGQVVLKDRPLDNAVGVSGLKPGIYIIEVSSKYWVFTKKLIIISDQ